jgi:hypothetical protein
MQSKQLGIQYLKKIPRNNLNESSNKHSFTNETGSISNSAFMTKIIRSIHQYIIKECYIKNMDLESKSLMFPVKWEDER